MAHAPLAGNVMFDRFTDDARRSLFFARAKTSERDGDEISTEDLLGGLLLAVPDAVVRFASSDYLGPAETVEEFFDRVEHRSPEWMAKTSREIRFSAAAQTALTKTLDLGGQGKTGHLSTLQNRPFPVSGLEAE